MNFNEYVSAFQEVERDFEQSVQEFGLSFETEESSPRINRQTVACKTHFHLENNTGSLWSNWISPACIACRTGEKTATFFVDLRCTKNCYFCFNPNQDYYEYFLHNTRDIVAELQEAYDQGAQFDCLAITGGEPMLHAGQVLDFITLAHQLYPQAHIRLYTSGDLTTSDLLQRMAQAGLTEIRFSIKPSDVEENTDGVYALIEQAVAHIPFVMLEVPVIPGTVPEMKEMMLRINELGVRGINLLEMCFPLCNAPAFKKRGLKLRKHPFNVLYNYWYGGGVPVANSERDALELVEFAHDEHMNMSVHYCSSDNKNTGQIYQQDVAFLHNDALRQAHPWLSLDEEDWFIKCAKVFGDDVPVAQSWLAHTACEGSSVALDTELNMLTFPLEFAHALKAAHPEIQIGESIYVMEPDEDNQQHLKEIWVREITDSL